jgi:hypothetical protein
MVDELDRDLEGNGRGLIEKLWDLLQEGEEDYRISIRIADISAEI